jgi:hypothetical protein
LTYLPKDAHAAYQAMLELIHQANDQWARRQMAGLAPLDRNTTEDRVEDPELPRSM